ncbi:hypothetical protein [Bacillus marasmi]|uniref:hypothetical protein n=1 Tax=Bacillus marasmi TaxID=1926279 RepID=UPI0011C8D5E5|nr:hypothetical protein [Bacillus marasmi]
MRKSLAFLFLIAFVLLSGCLKDPIQEDILNYVNSELSQAHKLEKKAVTAYESVTGANFTNDQALYDALQNEVIPTYKQFLQELKAVKIETEELEKIHDIYIKAAETQLEAFEVIIQALENQNPVLINQANDMLEQGRNQISDYQKKLDNLAQEHNVNLEKE